MKYPLITGFCGGLLIFVGCACLGHRTAAAITYRALRPLAFGSLNKPNHATLRADLLALQAVEHSQFVKDAPAELQKTADYLDGISSTKPPEIRPVLDLQIARCYAEIARLERDAGNAASADRHLQRARDLLNSLGWQDVSSEAVEGLTRGQLWWKATK